jgi:hypothetical protein
VLPLQIRVMHPEYGLGTVIDRTDDNFVKKNKWLKGDELIPVTCTGIISASIVAVYSANRYPNIILFDTGRIDMCSDIELDIIN